MPTRWDARDANRVQPFYAGNETRSEEWEKTYICNRRKLRNRGQDAPGGPNSRARAGAMRWAKIRSNQGGSPEMEGLGSLSCIACRGSSSRSSSVSSGTSTLSSRLTAFLGEKCRAVPSGPCQARRTLRGWLGLAWGEPFDECGGLLAGDAEHLSDRPSNAARTANRMVFRYRLSMASSNSILRGVAKDPLRK